MTTETHPRPTAGRRRKILVVDDDAVIIRTLTFKLKAAGYDVCSATDGADAVSATRKERPDLIVLDITFPPDVAHGGGVAWDGFLVMNWLRRIEDLKHTPIVAITAGDPAKYEKRSLETGAAAFFHKPIDHDALINSIRKILDDPARQSVPEVSATYSI